MRRTASAWVVAAGLLAARGADARGRECVEVSDVVGEQACTQYGAGWSIERRPPITFRFGFRYADFSTSGATFGEQYGKRERPKGYRSFSYPGSALGVGSVAALGLDGGVGLFVWGQLYTGLEGGVSLGSTATTTFTTRDVTLRDAKGVDVFMLHGGVPVGYRIPLGRASLRGEVLFGATYASISHVASGPVVPRDVSAGAGRWLVEPRLAADVWFTQHISFGHTPASTCWTTAAARAGSR